MHSCCFITDKVHTTDWIAATDTKSTAKVLPNNVSSLRTADPQTKCIFDEMENQENTGQEKSFGASQGSTSSPSKVLTESSKANIQVGTK